MSTIKENLIDRVYRPTVPVDITDPPRFSQLLETAKDAFIAELTQYFSYNSYDSRYKLKEIPTIRKFQNVSGSSTDNSLETIVSEIISYGDTPDKFPMVAISSATIKERKMNIGSNFVAHVQYPPSLVGTGIGPFNFDPGITATTDDYYYLDVKTCPTGDLNTKVLSRISFWPSIFADITNITVDDIVRVINKTQALYYTLSKTGDGFLRIECGGQCANGSPNYIEIFGGTTQVLTQLGFTTGDSDSYLSVDNPPRNRYSIAGDTVVNIDVISDSINTRTEVADLVFNFFAFYLEKRRFQFFGRSYFDRDLDPEEWFHIGLKNQFSWSGELVKPRQGLDKFHNIYVIRGSVPIFIEDFIDKKLIDNPVWLERDKIVPEDTLPDGDYFSVNYKNNSG